jgi:hypothetical protein
MKQKNVKVQKLKTEKFLNFKLIKKKIHIIENIIFIFFFFERF